jgi:hypothetical protein
MAKATNVSLAACFQLVVPTPLKLSTRHIVHSIDIIQLCVCGLELHILGWISCCFYRFLSGVDVKRTLWQPNNILSLHFVDYPSAYLLLRSPQDRVHYIPPL